MKSRKGCVAAFAFVVVVAAAGRGVSGFSQASTAARSFEFTYVTRIPELPGGAKNSRIWIPLPQSDSYQAISELKIESPFPYTTQRDSEYGNEYAYLEVPASKGAGPAEVRVRFQATRREHRVALGAQRMAAKTGAAGAARGDHWGTFWAGDTRDARPAGEGAGHLRLRDRDDAL